MPTRCYLFYHTASCTTDGALYTTEETFLVNRFSHHEHITAYALSVQSPVSKG